MIMASLDFVDDRDDRSFRRNFMRLERKRRLPCRGKHKRFRRARADGIDRNDGRAVRKPFDQQ